VTEKKKWVEHLEEDRRTHNLAIEKWMSSLPLDDCRTFFDDLKRKIDTLEKTSRDMRLTVHERNQITSVIDFIKQFYVGSPFV